MFKFLRRSGRSLPQPCEEDIFRNGQPILLIDGRSVDVESWVQLIRKKSGAQIDWNYSGGIAQVLLIDEGASRARVERAVNRYRSRLNGEILQDLRPGQQGAYRAGVDPTPPGSFGAFWDGAQRFFIKPEDRK